MGDCSCPSDEHGHPATLCRNQAIHNSELCRQCKEKAKIEEVADRMDYRTGHRG
jgi:hypothetical protein